MRHAEVMKNETRHTDISPPPTGVDSDEWIYEILDGIVGLMAVPVAWRSGLFDLVAESPMDEDEIRRALDLKERPAAALLAVCCALGALEKSSRGFQLTPQAARFLWSGSPSYLGDLLETYFENPQNWTLAQVQESLLSDQPHGIRGEEWTRRLESDPAWALRFTQGMHAHSLLPAKAWPGRVDLSANRVLLDVAGGSGIHSLEALRRWPELRAVVLESPAVCRCSGHFLKDAGVAARRLRFHAADMWSDPWPEADLHFFSDVFHDWSPEECATLAARSFAALPSQGRILVHEMLFNDQKTGPKAVAFSSLSMVLWTQGRQYSGAELAKILTGAGFDRVQRHPTFGCWSLVTARKP